MKLSTIRQTMIKVVPMMIFLVFLLFFPLPFFFISAPLLSRVEKEGRG